MALDAAAGAADVVRVDTGPADDIGIDSPRDEGGSGRGPRATRARSRAVAALGAVVAGYLIAHALGGAAASGVWFSSGLGLLGAAALARGRAASAWLALAAVCAGAGHFSSRVYEQPRDSLARRVEALWLAPAAVAVDGVVEGFARVNDRPRGALGGFARFEPTLAFDLRVHAVEGAAAGREGAARASGVVRVVAPAGSMDAPRPGDALRVVGLFEPPPPPLNPGERDGRLWEAQVGRVGTLKTGASGLVTGARLPMPPDARLAAWRERLIGSIRAGAHEAMDSALAGIRAGEDPAGRRAAAIIDALVLGARDVELDDVSESFTRQGVVHVLAISGFHLAALAGMLLVALRLLGDLGRLEAVIVAVAVAAYMVIVPANTPIVRAGVMVLAVLAAEASGRRYDRLTLLAWIAVGVLVWRPMDVFGAGFQLSFGVVAALMWLGPRARMMISRPGLKGTIDPLAGTVVGWLRGRFVSAAAASVLAWAVAMPTVAFHAGVISLLAPLTTLVVLPLAAAALALGFVAMALGAAAPSVAEPVGHAAGAAGWAMARAVAYADDFSFVSIRVAALPVWWVAAATACAAAWFRLGRRAGPALVLAAALSVGVVMVVIARDGHAPRGAALRVDTLAVGDGSCHLVRAGDGAMLWDCGSSDPGAGVRRVPRSLRALGVTNVELALVSHPDLDHFNALADVVKALGVRTLLVGERFMEEAAGAPSGPEALALSMLQKGGVEVRVVVAGDSFALGSGRCEVLWPPRGYDAAHVNDSSLVVRVVVDTAAGEKTALLTGDSGRGAIMGVLDGSPRLRAQIMELPHHGSGEPAARELVRIADPEVVLQSTGPSRLGDRFWRGVRGGRAWKITAIDGWSWAEVRRDGAVRAGAINSGR